MLLSYCLYLDLIKNYYNCPVFYMYYLLYISSLADDSHLSLKYELAVRIFTNKLLNTHLNSYHNKTSWAKIIKTNMLHASYKKIRNVSNTKLQFNSS